jgi:hypothetical protein
VLIVLVWERIGESRLFVIGWGYREFQYLYFMVWKEKEEKKVVYFALFLRMTAAIAITIMRTAAVMAMYKVIGGVSLLGGGATVGEADTEGETGVEGEVVVAEIDGVGVVTAGVGVGFTTGEVDTATTPTAVSADDAQ